jgi:uncharacterized protein (DUF427 family)
MERVWDYPRPPAVVPCERRVRVELGGELLADSSRALRVLETSHPPTIYVPPADVRADLLQAGAAGTTWCEFKGTARYLDAIVGDGRVRAVGWTYADPAPGYEALRDHVAFYPGRVDAAWLGDERIEAQASDFYGGWISADLVGPFKGPPGTLGW